MLLFYAIMLFLTIFARSIHNSQIPNVTITRMKKIEINGVMDYVIPISSYHNGNVFVIETVEKHGENYLFARSIPVEAGERKEEYIIIKSGLERWHKIIKNSDREFKNGDEIAISSP